MVVPVVQDPPIDLDNVNPDFHPDFTATTTTTTIEAFRCSDLGTNCNGSPGLCNVNIDFHPYCITFF